MWVQEQALISILPGVAFLLIFIDVGAFFATFSPDEDLFYHVRAFLLLFSLIERSFFVFMEGIFATFLYVVAFFPLLRLFFTRWGLSAPLLSLRGAFFRLAPPPSTKISAGAYLYATPHDIIMSVLTV